MNLDELREFLAIERKFADERTMREARFAAAIALVDKLRTQEPIGYLPAYELDRLKSGHSASLRTARFGASQLDGDIPVYAAPPAKSDAQVSDDVLDTYLKAWAASYESENPYESVTFNAELKRHALAGLKAAFAAPSATPDVQVPADALRNMIDWLRTLTTNPGAPYFTNGMFATDILCAIEVLEKVLGAAPQATAIPADVLALLTEARDCAWRQRDYSFCKRIDAVLERA